MADGPLRHHLRTRTTVPVTAMRLLSRCSAIGSYGPPPTGRSGSTAGAGI
jgi:hypothetical protein